MGKFALLLAFFGGTSGFALENRLENKLENSNDLLLEMDGIIYPKDQFPENCADFLRGGKCDAKPVGTMHLESKKDGVQVYSKTDFSDAEKIQVTEESWETNGHVKRVSIQNNIEKKVYELEVKNKKVFYKITNQANGKIETSDEDAEDNLVVPSTIMSYVGNQLGDLVAGKEVKVKVAAIDHQESFTFTLKKVRTEKTASGDPILVLALTANSIFVRSVVDPMYLYITKDGELSGFEGKAPLMRKVGDNKYKDMISKVNYHYGVDLLKPTLNAPILSQSCNEDVGKIGAKCEVIPSTTPAAASSSTSQAKENL